MPARDEHLASLLPARPPPPPPSILSLLLFSDRYLVDIGAVGIRDGKIRQMTMFQVMRGGRWLFGCVFPKIS